MIRLSLLAALVGTVTLACSSGGGGSKSMDADVGSGGSGGSGGSPPVAGSGGRGGAGGSAGSGGAGGSMGGMGGSAGSGGMGGSAGMGGSGGSGGTDAGARDSGTTMDAARSMDSGPTSDGGAASPMMSFFVTSAGTGMMGGNYGGLAGADAKCKMHATAVGVGDKNWRAFLSTTAGGGMQAVNARDRIGAGPWMNSRGQMVAMNVMGLLNNGIPAAMVLTERGTTVPQNEHDIVTGSSDMGTPMNNLTCQNWTSNAMASEVQVAHADGNPNQRFSAHGSRCSEAGLRATLGSGRIYCFAAGN